MKQLEEIGKIVVNEAFVIHKDIGVGLYESVYEAILVHRLRKAGLKVTSQVTFPVIYDGIRFDKAFVIDLLVEDQIILELKSTEKIIAAHEKQILTYLHLTEKPLGYIINFGAPYFKQGIKRMIHNYPVKKPI